MKTHRSASTGAVRLRPFFRVLLLLATWKLFASPTISQSWDTLPMVRANPLAMQKIAAAHISQIKYQIQWAWVNPAPNVYHWEKTDADFAAIKAAGLKIQVSITTAPAWVSGGFPTYEFYTDGCSACVNPYQGCTQLRFADEKAYCSNPPHIDSDAARSFAIIVAQRYGDRISYYSFWNEPGIDLYWPPIKASDYHADPAMHRLADEIIRPMVDGVRSINPKAIFVGPDADDGPVMESLLRYEHDLNAHWFDIISFHPYAWNDPPGFPQDSYDRINNEFMPALAPFRNGRPIWYTEIMGDSEKSIEWLNVVSKYDVQLINFYNFRQLWETGTWDNGPPSNGNETFVPSRFYYQIQSMIESWNPRRRPYFESSPSFVSRRKIANN